MIGAAGTRQRPRPFLHRQKTKPKHRLSLISLPATINVKTYHLMVKDSPATSATSPRGARIGFAPPLKAEPETVGTAAGTVVVAAGIGAARP
jgi:hypothetical protein